MYDERGNWDYGGEDARGMFRRRAASERARGRLRDVAGCVGVVLCVAVLGGLALAILYLLAMVVAAGWRA